MVVVATAATAAAAVATLCCKSISSNGKVMVIRGGNGSCSNGSYTGSHPTA